MADRSWISPWRHCGRALVLTIGLLAPISVAHAWFFVSPSQEPTAARALAIAPSGQVVAAGDIEFGHFRPFTVLRLDPQTGAYQGLYIHDFLHEGRANALAMYGQDAIAAGAVRGDADDFVVTRSTDFGGETWATVLEGTASCADDAALAVVSDGEAAVVAAGMFTNATDGGTESSFAVVKLGLDAGEVLWRTEIDDGVAHAVAIDVSGDVYAAGMIGGEFAVVKLDGFYGDVLWKETFGTGLATSLVPASGGGVVAAGQIAGAFAVAKLDSDTGESAWPFGPASIPGMGIARAVTTLSDDDIVAAGERTVSGLRRFVTARFLYADGSLDWEDADPEVPAPAAAYGVARSSADDLVTVGTAAYDGGPASFSARSLFSFDGSLSWGNGILSDDAETRALTVMYDADDNVLIGGQFAFFGFAPSFTVRKLDGDTGDDFGPDCGNGELDFGEDCDDGNTSEEDCCSSTCQWESAGEACDDDDNDCTDDVCDGEGTCDHVEVGSGPCDDGNDCTINDECDGSECFGEGSASSGSPCNADANPCTTDACNGSAQCEAVPNIDPCNDFNPCTTDDTCGSGVCSGTAQTGGTCDDFNSCTTGDACEAGHCNGSPSPGTPCFDDDNACTDDVCSAIGSCEHIANSAPCNDSDMCTTADHCEAGACIGTAGGSTTTSTSSTSSTSTTTSTSSSTSTSTSSSTTSSTSSTSTSVTTSTSSSTSTSTSSSTTSSTSSTSTSVTTSTSSSTSTSTSSSTTSSTSSTSTSVTTSTSSSTSTSTSSSTTSSTSSTSTSVTTSTSSSTSTSTTSTSISFPQACTVSADCDDGNPCNGGEVCRGFRCAGPQTIAGSPCQGAAPLAVVTNFGTNTAAIANTRTRTIDGTVDVGRAPWGVAWMPDGTRVFITNRESRSVSVLDIATRTIVATIDVGPEPLGIAVHPFLPRAYVTSYDGDHVDVLDTTTLSRVDRLPVGNGPAGVVVHPAGHELYVANYIANTVSVIDAATLAVTATIPTPSRPVGIDIDPQGTKLYLACLKARAVVVLGTVSHTILGEIRVGRQPVGVAFDANGSRAYVTNRGDDTLTVINAVTDLVIAKVPVGQSPLGVAVSDEGTVWVAHSRAGSVAVVDPAGGPTETVPLPGIPVGVGRFIGTPPDDCPAAALPCDDASPYTGDACDPLAGCVQEPIEGLRAVRAGATAMRAIAAASPDDPLVQQIARSLPALEGALQAAETGESRAAIQLVRRALKPVLKALEAARRQGALGSTGARLLDIAREARRLLRKLARGA